MDDEGHLVSGKNKNVFGNGFSTLPACRNDRGFAFAIRQYCQVVELSDEASQQVVTRIGERRTPSYICSLVALS